MNLTNKVLRTKNKEYYWVMLIYKDGVMKYISRCYGRKHAFSYTVLLKDAKKFDSIYAIKHFAECNGITEYKVGTVSVVTTLDLIN